MMNNPYDTVGGGFPCATHERSTSDSFSTTNSVGGLIMSRGGILPDASVN